MSEDLKEMRNVTRGREGGVEGPGRGAHRGFRPMGGEGWHTTRFGLFSPGQHWTEERGAQRGEAGRRQSRIRTQGLGPVLREGRGRPPVLAQEARSRRGKWSAVRLLHAELWGAPR